MKEKYFLFNLSISLKSYETIANWILEKAANYFAVNKSV